MVPLETATYKQLRKQTLQLQFVQKAEPGWELIIMTKVPPPPQMPLFYETFLYI
jgi:hypothetical protein